MLLITMSFRSSDCERSACFDTQVKFREFSEDKVMIMTLGEWPRVSIYSHASELESINCTLLVLLHIDGQANQFQHERWKITPGVCNSWALYYQLFSAFL
jgi:hypothetical protein